MTVGVGPSGALVAFQAQPSGTMVGAATFSGMELNPVDLGDIAATAAALFTLGTVIVAIFAARIAVNAKAEAARSADAAEDSASSSKRSADAAEQSAQADTTIARLAEEEANRYTTPWEVQPGEGKGQYRLVNTGTEDAHDVWITGDALAPYFKNGTIIRAQESVVLSDTRAFGSFDPVQVVWKRPPEKGGEQYGPWKHDLS